MAAARTRSESLERFFCLLAGDAGPGQFLELRHRLASGEGMGQEFVPVARSRTLASRVLGTGRYTDVYVGCAPRLGRRGGRDAVGEAWVAWADLDRPGADVALERFALRPSAVVASGSGEHRHVYFCLAEAVGGGEVELLNRRLAAALGRQLEQPHGPRGGVLVVARKGRAQDGRRVADRALVGAQRRRQAAV